VAQRGAPWAALAAVTDRCVRWLAVQGAARKALEAILGYNAARAASTPAASAGRDRVHWQLFRDGLAPLWLPAIVGLVVRVAGQGLAPPGALGALDIAALFAGGDKFTPRILRSARAEQFTAGRPRPAALWQAFL